MRCAEAPSAWQALREDVDDYILLEDFLAPEDGAGAMSVALAALRHRVLLNFEGEADGVDPDKVVAAIIEHTKETIKGEALQRA